VSRRKGQQLSILDGCPADVPSGLNLVADDVTCRAPADALVERCRFDLSFLITLSATADSKKGRRVGEGH